MPEFTGFAGEQLAAINKAHVEAVRCIDSCLSKIGTTDFEIKFAKYFGSAKTAKGWGNSDSTYVFGAINAMHIAAKAGTYKVVYGGKLDGTNAAMLSFALEDYQTDDDQKRGGFKYNNKVKHIFQAVVERTKATFSKGTWTVMEARPMTVYDGFFDNPLWAPDAQCHVQSYLHELSHHVAGTLDVTLNNGMKAYGWDLAKQAVNEGVAAHNAENVGLFVASFYPG